MRFTLEHRQWYGLEMTGDEFHDTLWEPRYRHFSPIKVLEVTPHGRGNRHSSPSAFTIATTPQASRVTGASTRINL
jgi:hypothetical protein